MYHELIKSRIYEQAAVYQQLKDGHTDSVRYMKSCDESRCVSDSNYVNRSRLAHYLLYAGIDDEAAVLYLFQEELKDRKTNTFQGIGDSLNVLASILNRYNAGGKHRDILNEAKNANFDCACGFDINCAVNGDISALSLMDCILLSLELGYKDVMEVLVDKWVDSIIQWTDADLQRLASFNTFLGREQENETLFRTLLKNAAETGNTFDIVSAYSKLIEYHIGIGQHEAASSYLRDMTDKTDFSSVERIRLFGGVLEEACELVSARVKDALSLWQWAKPYLQIRKNMYGNLFTKGIAAAKSVNDPYAAQLEREYIEWRKSLGLKID